MNAAYLEYINSPEWAALRNTHPAHAAGCERVRLIGYRYRDRGALL